MKPFTLTNSLTHAFRNKGIRYVMLAALALCLMVALAGCGGSQQQSSSRNNESSPSSGVSLGLRESEASQELEAEPTIEITDVEAFGPYSEGLSWVHFEEYNDSNETEWAGFVNDKGEVQFKYEFESRFNTRSKIPEFKDGVVYIDYYKVDGSNSIKSCYAIDNKGEVLGDFDNVVAFGGGSVITQEYKDGFEGTAYEYTMLDNSGKEVNTFEVKGNQSYDVTYCGEGVFAFTGTNMKDMLYFTKSNELSESDFDAIPEFDGLSDKALLSYDESENNSAITLISSAGKTDTIELGDLKGWINEAWLDGDVCTLKVSSLDQDRMVSYNVKSGALYDLDPKYVDAIDWYQGTQIRLADDRYAFMMKGADNGTYLGIFDETWKPVIEPIKAESTSNLKFSDGRVLTRNSSNSHIDAYDTDGKLVFSLDSGGSVLNRDFSESTLCYAESGTPYCYDLNGKLVFNEIVDGGAPNIFDLSGENDASNQAKRQVDGYFGIASSKLYSTDNGDLLLEATYQRDNRGLVTLNTTKKYKDGSTSTQTTAYTYDDNGNEATRKITNDGKVYESTCYPTLGSDGRVESVTVINDDTGSIATLEYEYYADGSIKQYREKNGDTVTQTQLYNEGGLETELINTNATYRFSWKTDDAGRPVSADVEKTSSGGSAKEISTYTFDTDDAGNILREYDEENRLIAEFTYEKITQPAESAKSWGRTVRIYL